MDSLFRLRLLGTPQVSRNDQPVRGFESRKALALLCYVAVHGEPLSRTHLADLFWGDKPEAKGRGNLSRVLHNLNDLFPSAFNATRDTIQLKPAVFSLDLSEFERDAAQATPDGLAAAALLYRDEFMAGLFLDDCPEFEVWLVQERERWHQRVVSVLECLSGYYAQHGEFSAALPFAARLLEIEPWREETHRQMMQLLSHTGQRSAALQQYEIARRVLREEMGIEPSSETISLYEQIRREEIAPVAPSPIRHNLPTALTSFFGREAEITRITARLNNPDCRLLTIVGAGGIGKTRLALEAATHLLGSFRDGVYFVPLASIGVGEIDMIVSAIANALQFKFAGSQEPKTQLLHIIRDKQMLLLLDNFEHLLEGRPLVIEILQGAPNAKIIATSREPLTVQAEWITRVTGLSYPTVPRANDDITHYSAVQLFVERASRVNQNFALSKQTTPNVIRICQIVEGMPLAIELAAAAHRTLRVQDIAEQLARNLDLTIKLHDSETRHESMRSVLDWSYALLSEPEQVLFRKLSVFVGGWTFDASRVVCEGEGVEQHNVQRLLDELVDKSLVLKEEREEENWYRMLEPIHQYSLEKLVQSVEEKKLRQRHADYYAALTKQDLPEKFTRAEWLDRIESYVDNLRSALAWSQNNDTSAKITIALAGAMWSYCYHRGYLNEGKEWLERTLASTETLNNLFARAWTTQFLVEAYAELGDRSTAETQYNTSLKLFEQLGDRSSYAWTLNRMGWLAREYGDATTAQTRLQESLELFRNLEDQENIAWASITLGEVFVMLEEAEVAGSLIEEGLSLFRSIKVMFGEAWALNHLGHVRQLQGDYGRAQQLHEASLLLFQQYDFQLGFAWTYQGLGETALAQGNSSVATKHLKKALSQFHNMGHLAGIGWCLAGLGGAYSSEENLERAASLWGAARTLRNSIGARYAPAARMTHERLIAQTKSRLGESVFAMAWAKGEEMTFEQAIAYAMQEEIKEANF